MLQITHLLADDPNLGRVNNSSFSDQTLMELLISDIPDEAKQDYQGSDGTFLDVCSWPGVKCNDEARVTQFERDSDTRGTVQLSYIPSSVFSFVMSETNLHGTLETSSLPRGLGMLFLATNKLEGTVDFGALPPQSQYVSLAENSFSGSADLSRLPDTLQRLWINTNKFSGTLCLTKLPPALNVLDIFQNAFSGDFHFANSPKGFYTFHADNNCFNAIAVVEIDAFAGLKASGVTSVVDLEGNAHPKEKEMLETEFVDQEGM